MVKEFLGKTVDEAVEIGLKELGLSKEDVEITVLEEGKKKLFGYVKAKVQISYEETPAEIGQVSVEDKTDGERAVEFLEGLFDIMNLTAAIELVKEQEKIIINVTAANSNAVIGKRGAVLDAVQTLAGAVANTGRNDYKRVVVDCEDYREKREETLKKLAENLASKAIRLGRKIRLEPMNAYERRIIHAALSEREDVSTKSEGKEPNRYLVIVPSNEEGNRPALPAREERRERGDRRGGFNKDKRGGFSRDKKFGAKRGDRRDKPRQDIYKKPDVDFFGTFLGNSGNKSDEE